ncbi:MAG: Ig-like domain-containing protein [Gemmatimonadota bacterium]|nr:Ig-like domain-containing protein [Gemmatimonadota bacterium]
MPLPASRARSQFSRVLAAGVAAWTLAACGDFAPAATHGVASRNLAPAFQRAVFDAAVSITQMHIVITRPPSTVALVDTIVSVAPGADSVAVSLKVPLASNEDHLSATIDLLESGTVLYHGAQDIVAKPGRNKNATSVVYVQYVGPGAGAARVAVAPADTSIPANGSVPYAASVFDHNGSAMSAVPIVWTVGDNTLGSVSTNGLFSGAGRRGTASVIATTWSGVADTVHVTLRPAAIKLTVVSGAGQSAPAGSTLPQPVVIESDGVDGAVAGVTVHFDAGTSGGSVQPQSAVTDASGRASVQITLGTVTGPQQFNATAPGLAPAAIGATATAVATAIAKSSGDGQADSVGTALKPFVVKVTDAYGNAAPGATVSWAVIGGTGSLSSASSTTDASGLASVTYTLSKTSRTDSVRATLAGTSANVIFTASAFQRGAAKLVVIAGDGQSGIVGAVLGTKFVVQAQDALGNPVSNAAVQFAASSTTALVNPPSAVTDASGEASTTITLGGTPGTYTFTATAGKASASVKATATAGSAALLALVSGNAQADSAGLALNPFVVKATDQKGNAVAGATVAWAVLGGSGSLAAASSVTDANGLAQAVYTLSRIARVDTVEATLAGTKASVLFTATALARGVAKLVATAGDAQSGVVGVVLPTKFSVRASDVLGNPVAGLNVTFSASALGASVSPRAAVTDATGTASTSMTLGSVLGAQVFAASAGTLSASVTETAIAGQPTALTKIAGDAQSDTACATLKNPLVVRATDLFGNGVANASVVWAQVGGPGSHNSATLATDSLGYSAANYQLPNTAGVDTLTATLQSNSKLSVMFTETITTSVSTSCPSTSALRASWTKR